jgi:hypothetical protein
MATYSGELLATDLAHSAMSKLGQDAAQSVRGRPHRFRSAPGSRHVLERDRRRAETLTR